MVDDSDALMAVVAHGLLNSMATVAMVLQALERTDLDEARRTQLSTHAMEQTQHVIGVLKDLMRGCPPEVLTALEGISTERHL